MTSDVPAEHFFRHEYGRLVAILCNQAGLEHIHLIEDAVQNALVSGLEHWGVTGTPENPSAWLYRVARNNLLGELRQRSSHSRLQTLLSVDDLHQPVEQVFAGLKDDVQDDLLRMLFACCDSNVSENAQLVLALKVLCGFNIHEIASRLFIKEETAYKRMSRARQQLQQHPIRLDSLSGHDLIQRLPAIQKVLYLMFTEGYLSLHAEFAIRRELCDESIRLATLLANHPFGSTPKTCALLALMHLHRARMSARQDGSGGLLLLEEQDRDLWDSAEIRIGINWLAMASEGDEFSRYHAEAGVAAEHALAISYQHTRWEKIIECYALLEQSVQSPVHTLNRAIALAEWKGPVAGLQVLENMEPPAWLLSSFIWAATSADLHYRCGHIEIARMHEINAMELAPTTAIQALLKRRLSAHQN